MPIDILVPPLSQTMDSLVLVEWLKKAGEPVAKGEPLFRVETDKATLEVEAPASGVLLEVLAQPGEEVRVRSRIGAIAAADDLQPGGTAAPATPAAARGETPVLANGPAAAATGPLGEPLPPERLNRIFASPRARHFAAQHAVPLEALQGSGPQNLIIERDVSTYLERSRAKPRATPLAQRIAQAEGLDLSNLAPARPGAPITKADVEASLRAQEEAAAPEPSQLAAAPPPAPAAVGRVIPLSPVRKTIARRLHESHTAAVPVTYMREVDATRLAKLRRRILEKVPEGAPRPTYTDFLARILCQVLLAHPEFNATCDGENLELYDSVHLALAVDTPRGLLAPVIRDAQAKGVLALAAARVDLVERALQGTLDPGALSGGSFTLSNLGSLGIDHFTPILNPPQVAILGAGRIRQAPAVHKGKLRIRCLLGLSLTCDHRVIDGAPAARFLEDLCARVEDPDRSWL